ncbi:MAG: IclR family transcriptional regulator [Desulfomonilaceae bacterium]
MKSPVNCRFKRVPAIDKCFGILDLMARSRGPFGISEIAKRLSLNKSTVFNIIHTLMDLHVLESTNVGNLNFAPRLHILGKAASSRSDLIRIVHPFLKQISAASNFSAFLGVRFGLKVVIVDKVDAAVDIKISSEVGMRLPLFAGAGGKALLSLLPDSSLDRILSENELKRFTPHSIVDVNDYKKAVVSIREQGVAYDLEEYIEGVVAVSVPINAHARDLQAAIWAAGLRAQVSDEKLAGLSVLFKQVVGEINTRLSPG